MASLQCYKPDQTYNQGQYHPSLVNTEIQYTSETQTYYPDSGLAEAQTAQRYSQTQTSNPNHTLGYGEYNSHAHTHHDHGTGTGSTQAPGLGLGGLGHGHGLTRTHGSTHGHDHGLTQTHSLYQTCSSNGAAASGCNRTLKKRSEHKRGLFQKLKDGLSGDGSSSSDSENENEKGETRVFCQQNYETRSSYGSHSN